MLSAIDTSPLVQVKPNLFPPSFFFLSFFHSFFPSFSRCRIHVRFLGSATQQHQSILRLSDGPSFKQDVPAPPGTLGHTRGKTTRSPSPMRSWQGVRWNSSPFPFTLVLIHGNDRQVAFNQDSTSDETGNRLESIEAHCRVAVMVERVLGREKRVPVV